MTRSRLYGHCMATPAAEPNLDRERLKLALQSARLGEYDWDMVADVLHISPLTVMLVGIAVRLYLRLKQQPELHKDEQ